MIGPDPTVFGLILAVAGPKLTELGPDFTVFGLILAVSGSNLTM
jgi:hypothetical protein